MVFLAGGPPHQDMFDLKPDAPDGIRGEFRPISTDVPGLEICEHMPRLARMMNKFVVIRSLVGAGGDHSAGQCLTGYKDLVSRAQGGRPSLGAVVSQLQGPVEPRHPAVRRALAQDRRSRGGATPAIPGYLGLAHAPFTPFRSERSAGTSKLAQRPGGTEPRRADDRPGSARRPPVPARASSTTCAGRSIDPRRWRAWTRSPSRRSRSWPRGGSSRPST